MDIRHWLAKAQTAAKKLRGATFSGIWLPRPVQITNPAEHISRTFLTWREVYPNSPPPSLQEIQQWVSHFDMGDLLQTLSRLNYARYASYAHDGKFVGAHLVRELFEPNAYAEIVKFQESRGSVTLSRSMLVMLQTICLASCKNTGGSLVRDDPTAVGRAMLAAASYCEGDQVRELGNTQLDKTRAKEIVFGSMYRNFVFNAVDRVAWTMARYWTMLTECRAMVPPQESFDLDSALMKVTGLPWKAHLAYGFTVCAYYSREEPIKFLNDSPGDFLLPQTYFSKSTASSVGEKVLLRLSRPIEDLAKLAADDKFLEAYNFRWLFDSPLVRLPSGALYPLDLHCLAARVTSGIYWELHESLRGTADFVRFKAYWGRLFEIHVLNVLMASVSREKSLARRLFVEHMDGFEGGVDFIVLDGADAVFIQATTEHVPVLEILSGDWKRIKKSIEKLLIQREGAPGKIHRLGRAIARFRRGELKLEGVDPAKIKRIFPVLMMEQGLAQIPGVTAEIRELVAANTELGSLAEYLEFWDAEELELSEGLFRSGITACIQDKHDIGFDELPLKNYIHKKNPNLESSYIRAAYERAGQGMKDVLFRGGPLHSEGQKPPIKSA